MLLLPTWTYIGLVAVILWVAGSYFDKYLLERYFGDSDESGPGALIIFSSYFSFIIALGVLLLRFEDISFALSAGLSGLAIGVISGAWILSYLYALHRTDVSRVVPIFQTIPVFGLLLGFIFLGETLSVAQILAAAAVIGGALILFHNQKASFLGIDYTTLGLMLLASFILALTETTSKVVAIETNYWTTVFWTSTGLAVFGVILFTTIKKYREEATTMMAKRFSNVLQANSFNEVIDNSADLIFFFAITIGPIALVQSLNAYQPLIALTAGFVLARIAPSMFHEELATQSLLQKILGILIMTIASVYLYSLI